ncbi:hypothetical protein BDD14_3205 [Edaphobacter modestus]|uniref:Uncharacterized protein n=1 Tax=Edaphobacter modestus TaxID=388466 RepID=A0A4Q7YX74_9BACT|nr:hypothetical protein BDD14_3205 [Edaphobacter modestus]
MIIPLRDALLRRFSNLPAGFGSGFELSFSAGLSAWAHRADTPSPPGEKRRSPCLFGLAPCGVYHAAFITDRAVRSYRTFSPLPRLREAVCSLLHWPSRWLEPSVPDVIRHTALRSSDFPLPCLASRLARQRSSGRLPLKCIASPPSKIAAKGFSRGHRGGLDRFQSVKAACDGVSLQNLVRQAFTP